MLFQKSYKLNYYVLDRFYNEFAEFVKEKDGRKSISFSSGYLAAQEGYKEEIRKQAQAIIKEMKHESIGSGEIMGCVIRMVELERNNLCPWQSRYGEKSRPHNSLYEAKVSGKNLKRYEELLYGFFESSIDDKIVFDELVGLAGKKYSYIAYLFFIKNAKKYLPIAPKNFDDIFSLLEINFITSKKCSWENYSVYCGLISEIRNYLSDLIKEDISLIDTHSFLWIIDHQLKEKTAKKKWVEISKVGFCELNLVNLAKREEEANKDGKTGNSFYFNSEDTLKNNREMKRRGDKAEAIVLEKEKDLLYRAGKKELAERVKIVGGDASLGYDIESYTENGEIKRIEVKGTICGLAHNKFYISKNEIEKSKKLENYYLYLVYDLDNLPSIRYIKTPDFYNSDIFEIIPQSYEVKYRSSEG